MSTGAGRREADDPAREVRPAATGATERPGYGDGADAGLRASAGAASGRGFWLVFTLAWLAYSALFASLAAAEGEPLRNVLLAMLGNVGPAVALAVIVGLRRRSLFRPERSLLRTGAIHMVVGLAYAAGMAVLAELVWPLLAMFWVGDDPMQQAPFIFHVVNGIFLYVILAGFLMWTESIQRVQESRALAAREAVLRARAEARALRAQFNPHFVFNTLHSLILLIRADPPAAEQAIEDVAALIRYASRLQREEIDAVPLEQEIEFARRYLALEKLRLDDRLAVVWDVAPGVGGATVPAFALQTLLENAVRHGVAPRADGATIRVRAGVEDDAVAIVVEDDGAGADAAAVGDSGGHGLHLLGQRLDVLYGDEASLAWDTAPGDGFRVALIVPAGRPRGPAAGAGRGPEARPQHGSGHGARTPRRRKRVRDWEQEWERGSQAP